jgi:hypothetical protein
MSHPTEVENDAPFTKAAAWFGAGAYLLLGFLLLFVYC